MSYYDNLVRAKRPKKRCAGSPDRPECAEMIIDFGQRDKCLDCLESVKRTLRRKYESQRAARNRAAKNVQPAT